MYGKIFVLVLLASALCGGCSGNTPTAPSPPSLPTGALPDPSPAPPSPPTNPPPAPAPSPPPAPPPPAPTITRSRFLAFGDSVTAGATSPAVNRTMSAGLPQSYPFKLQSLLSARYTTQSVVVFNEGVPLEEAADAVRRLPGVLRSASPDVVILLHGVNDLTGPTVVSRTLGHMNTMARDARFFGAQVFLCTLPPHRPGGSRAGDPVAIANYNAGLRDLARGEGATLVDLDRLIDLSLIGVDGLHPTEAGYERIAQVISALVKTLYERP